MENKDWIILEERRIVGYTMEQNGWIERSIIFEQWEKMESLILLNYFKRNKNIVSRIGSFVNKKIDPF